MQQQMLGKTKLFVSRLCFGSLTLGPLQANLTPDDAGALIEYAVSRGINFLDTAQFYQNYPHIRAGLKRIGSDALIIASKTYSYTREQALAAVEEARRELDRDVIDLFLLHEQESEHTFRGHVDALDALYECKAKGIVKAVGASTHHIAGVRAATKLGLDVIHPLINIAGLGIVDGTREEMESALTAAADAGLGIYGMKALGGGNLFFRAEECFDYILSLPYLNSVAVGMQSFEEIDADLHYFTRKYFTGSQRYALQSKSRHLLIEDWCVGCGACRDACSQNAITIESGHAVCDPSRCLLCGYCSGHCPEWCIKII